jgi:hypothetical protein
MIDYSTIKKKSNNNFKVIKSFMAKNGKVLGKSSLALMRKLLGKIGVLKFLGKFGFDFGMVRKY